MLTAPDAHTVRTRARRPFHQPGALRRARVSNTIGRPCEVALVNQQLDSKMGKTGGQGADHAAAEHPVNSQVLVKLVQDMPHRLRELSHIHAVATKRTAWMCRRRNDPPVPYGRHAGRWSPARSW